MNRDSRAELYRRLRAANPSPTTELRFSSPFELLVAVVLSAQATDKSVNIVTRRLFPLAPTPQAIRSSSESWVGRSAAKLCWTWRSIGMGPHAYTASGANCLAWSVPCRSATVPRVPTEPSSVETSTSPRWANRSVQKTSAASRKPSRN